MDVNASIGCEISDRAEDGAYRTIGPFGIPHTNRDGYRLRYVLNIHNYGALTSFLKKNPMVPGNIHVVNYSIN